MSKDKVTITNTKIITSINTFETSKSFTFNAVRRISNKIFGSNITVQYIASFKDGIFNDEEMVNWNNIQYNTYFNEFNNTCLVASNDLKFRAALTLLDIPSPNIKILNCMNTTNTSLLKFFLNSFMDFLESDNIKPIAISVVVSDDVTNTKVSFSKVFK